MPQLGPPDSDSSSNDSDQDREAPARETDRQSNGTQQRPELDTHVAGSKCAEEGGLSEYTHTPPERISLGPNLTPHIKSNSERITGQEGQEEPLGVMAGWYH